MEFETRFKMTSLGIPLEFSAHPSGVRNWMLSEVNRFARNSSSYHGFERPFGRLNKCGYPLPAISQIESFDPFTAGLLTCALSPGAPPMGVVIDQFPCRNLRNWLMLPYSAVWENARLGSFVKQASSMWSAVLGCAVIHVPARGAWGVDTPPLFVAARQRVTRGRCLRWLVGRIVRLIAYSL